MVGSREMSYGRTWQAIGGGVVVVGWRCGWGGGLLNGVLLCVLRESFTDLLKSALFCWSAIKCCLKKTKEHSVLYSVLLFDCELV